MSDCLNHTCLCLTVIILQVPVRQILRRNSMTEMIRMRRCEPVELPVTTDNLIGVTTWSKRCADFSPPDISPPDNSPPDNSPPNIAYIVLVIIVSCKIILQRVIARLLNINMYSLFQLTTNERLVSVTAPPLFYRSGK